MQKTERMKRIVEGTYELERATGCPEVNHLRDDAGYAAGRLLAESEDLELLKLCPDWLIQRLNKVWVEPLERGGKIELLASHASGEPVDATPIAIKVRQFLGAKNA